MVILVSLSVSGIMFDHFGVERDAITVVFPKHKGDQEGEHSQLKHIYANPQNPEICPFLAFAMFIWSIGFRRDGAKRLVFGGTRDPEERFSSWLRKLMGSSADDLVDMGIIIMEMNSELSKLSYRWTIYLTAGWSLGAVTARYIFEGGGGDQLYGRAATFFGICIMEPSFADLSPHFDLSKGAVLTVSQWEEILPNYTTFYPTSFLRLS